MDKKIELQVINITNSQAQVGAFAMLLGEVNGERQLPIIIGPAEAQATALYLKGVKTPRPLTHDLFITSLTMLGASLIRVLIYKAKDGIFYSYIYLKKTKKLYVSTHGLQTQLPWQCVPTARFLFMNLFLNRNVFTCRQKKEPVLKKRTTTKWLKKNMICPVLLPERLKKHWNRLLKMRITS